MLKSAYCLLLVVSVANACLDNYEYHLVNEWKEGGNWKSNGHIKPNFNYKLRNWELRLEFNEPLTKDFKAWVVRGYQGTKGRSKISLKPMDWNKVLDSSFDMSYFVFFKNRQGPNHLKCVEFCGIKLGSSENICDTNVVVTTTTSSQPATTTTTVSSSPKTSSTTTTKSPTNKPTTTTKSTTKPTTTTKSSTTKPTTTTKSPTTKPTTTTKSPTTSTTTTLLATKPTQCTPKYNYAEVLDKSLLFYEAQRSGDLPPDQRVKWRKDSTMTDGDEAGLDLTGGYFDAGDYVKFGFPMAATVTNLAWGMLEFNKGYVAAGQREYGLKAIKWGTDYFLKCHPSAKRFIGQVGDGDIDHAWWGRPEDMKLVRPVYDINEHRPGSELAAETAASLAASYLLFRDNGDLMYALNLLTHAKQLYSFAMENRGTYHEAIPDATNYYRSFSGYKDELAWASLWLYRATGEEVYKENFLKEFQDDALNQDPGEFSWDNKWYGVKVLAQQLEISETDYLSKFKTYLQQPKKTPKGLFYVQKWGPNRHAANLAFLASVASTLTDQSYYQNFARGQINYMLGDSGRSYVVGFGKDPPQRPHHRSSSCPPSGECGWSALNAPGPNPHILYGALVGGPDSNDGYVDNRSDYIKNEVACDYNAGFQSAVAGLLQFSLEGSC